ncbi:type I DNA topoisomerase [Leptospira sp. GIMC2001]|uniref:type I DNA topoisomerase n=1 Tax=Leptospira sp. GIMC2001 TaxID=1513297 RepID=UPI002349BD0A|nr:type I DNA topoisomerase [Leptospira sp. GIMC2001]WCL50570.1 type I DNA topoisomerase [Leptospira sp. GIMC2001]
MVESPAKAKTIQSYLGNNFQVYATGGHIVDLPTYKLAVHVTKDFAIDKEIIPKKKKSVEAIIQKIQKADTIYVATDPDREGEAIAFDIKNLDPSLSAKKEWIRVGFREITEQTVQDKILNPDSFNDRIRQSQETRRILDRLFGYLVSPLLWKKIAQGLSAGRVQSVLLKWICEREKKILDFKPEEYFDIDALHLDKNNKLIKFSWLGGDIVSKPKVEFWKKLRIDPSKIDEKNSFPINDNFKIIDIQIKETSESPQSAFKTSTLQETAAKVLGFPPKKTMRLAQSLYEGIDLVGGKRTGLITYPRTDSTRISSKIVKSALSIIEAKLGKRYMGRESIAKSSNKIQDAHEAIRPTMLNLAPDDIKNSLSNDEFKLYDLIWKRFFASLSANRTGKKSTTKLEGLGENWKLEVFLELFDGYLRWYDRKSNDQVLPTWKIGDSVKIHEISIEVKFTEPPPRFNYASLIKKMESTGVGRPSTYSQSIEILSERKYIEWEKKFCKPTGLGSQVNLFLVQNFAEFLEDDFTKNLESDLDDIENGENSKSQVLEPFYQNLQTRIKNQNLSPVSKNLCPICEQGFVQRKKDRKGKLIAYCSRYPECEYGEYL